MKLITYSYNNKEAVGILYGEDKVIPVKSLGLEYDTMNQLILGLDDAQKAIIKANAEKAEKLEISDVKLLAPIPFPMQDVLCLGLNYSEHSKEAVAFSDAFIGGKDKAVYFSKRVSVPAGDGALVSCYRNISESCDYEAELGVILGRDALNVEKEDVKNYIFGYTIINDMTLRDVQTSHKQWYFGKSLDGYTPMGPCIITADEISYPPVLSIGCRVNVQVRQSSTTDKLIHDIDEVVNELSQGMTLKAGTIIATGTPNGVAMGMEKPEFLKPGDVVECTIEKIGTLTITMVD